MTSMTLKSRQRLDRIHSVPRNELENSTTKAREMMVMIIMSFGRRVFGKTLLKEAIDLQVPMESALADSVPDASNDDDLNYITD